ncbi:hypothetical protein GQ457_16G000990 [Hibiscus cannabinus]
MEWCCLPQLNWSRPPAALGGSTIRAVSLRRHDKSFFAPPEASHLPRLVSAAAAAKSRRDNLSCNRIEGDISKILQSLSSCSLHSLESLNMEDNLLSGHLTDQLAQFKSLVYLSLAINRISGPIPLSIGELSSLKFLDVSANQLNGTFPSSLGQLTNLETLKIEKNLLEGVVLETYFSNLTRLTTLAAYGNTLRFQPHSSWVPSFQCATIELGQWHLGPKFPRWLQFQRNLSNVDISHAGISDVVPAWFWNLSSLFDYVDLSSNDLTGVVPYLNVRLIVDLSSNRFTRPLPRVLPTLRYLILSNNSFSGSLFEIVCNSSESRNMWFLDISTNLLSGEIPDCWSQWQQLNILKLGNNNLRGKIPSSLGYTDLVELNLQTNSMFGELPSTLQNCSKLVILDLSENHFSGSVPAWIGHRLSNLVVLKLRSNNFDGHVPHKICALPSLRNLDLAHNNISGAIPKCFSNFRAMATKYKASKYLDRVHFGFSGNLIYLTAILELKGREDEYSSTLRLVTSMDLSANSFIGEIPKELGTLIGLLSLNLSRNLLTGKIPDNIGNMKSMESLDLSVNLLHGGIPSSFSNLNFLNHFNVSYNNLTGQIPISTQLQSFENSSYMPNHLCGSPVSKSCITKGVPIDGGSSEGSNGRFKVNGFYVSIAVGFVMGFWGVVGPLFFIESWRRVYYQKLEYIGRVLGYYGYSSCNKFQIQNRYIIYSLSMHPFIRNIVIHPSIQRFEFRNTSRPLAVIIRKKGSILKSYLALETGDVIREELYKDIYNFGEIILEILTNGRLIKGGQSIHSKPKDAVLREMYHENEADSTNSLRDEIKLVVDVAMLCTKSRAADRPSMEDALKLLSRLKPKGK